MNKLEQAARQILEAIEGIGFVSDYWDEKITALREALAEQAEQEPVGYTAQSVIDWLSSNERTDFAYSNINLHKKPTDNDLAPLYAAPVRTKDLTDDEIVDASGIGCALPNEIDRFRAVIAADREKNK